MAPSDEYYDELGYGPVYGSVPFIQASPQYFRPEQYLQYMQQAPPPPVGFPQPSQPAEMPVIPNIPFPAAQNVIPNAVPGISQRQFFQQNVAEPMHEPVIPTIGRRQNSLGLNMSQIPQQATMPEPFSFPEPQIPSDAPPSHPPQGPGSATGSHGFRDVPTYRAPSPLRNPLPAPPKDLFELSPYMAILEDLRRPIDESTLKRSFTLPARQPQTANMEAGPSVPTDTIISSGTRGRHRRRGSLFSAFGSRRRRHEDDDNRVPIIQPAEGAAYASNPPVPQIVQIVSSTGTPRPMRMPANPVTTISVPTPGPSSSAHRVRTPAPLHATIKIHRGNDFASLLHDSPHPVHYEHKSYPTALHLFEAMKFMGHKPDIAERIRACPTVEEARAVSESASSEVRPDWERVVLENLDEVLYHKFIQHPALRALLMGTGTTSLLVSDSQDSFFGDGPIGQGANQLGKALMRVRERLREEGVST
ncbi:DUF1768-domain-containing protein [Laetiporus sulphureus 93-53]|uniref:DUF1768-domain-containing protein n=1 Tax=Laetiporus sulphureus 93-53 TaxID=1314785 RepID=A0A165E908_9APHY|nr:DUF1768-domain-containing protein [Laetiporus sulphureus 93-53]KZT06498.1 DUF1768-domain-containing protein [Laetiporus sulphureus 93-53]